MLAPPTLPDASCAMRTLSLIFLVVLTSTLRSGAGSPYHVHEKRTHIPFGWTLTKCPGAAFHPFVVRAQPEEH